MELSELSAAGHKIIMKIIIKIIIRLDRLRSLMFREKESLLVIQAERSPEPKKTR